MTDENNDLEKALLAGLPEQERRETLDSLHKAAADELARMRVEVTSTRVTPQ